MISDKLTPRDIETVFHRLNISLNGSKPDGNGWKTIKSPLRDEKNPSFGINLQTGAWRDHGTDESGDIVTLTERIKRMDTVEAISWIKEQTDLSGALYQASKKGKNSNSSPRGEGKQFWTNKRIEWLRKYQQSRCNNPNYHLVRTAAEYDCLTTQTLLKYGCSVVKKYSKEWLAFPYPTGCQLYRRNKTGNKKVISSVKGSSPGASFFGAKQTSGHDVLFVAKSPRECMLLSQEYGAGADVIGLVTGEQGKLSPKQIEALRSQISKSNYSNIYVFLDCDSEAAKITAQSLAREISNALEFEFDGGVWLVNIHSQTGGACKDITDCIRDGMDTEAFEVLISDAEKIGTPQSQSTSLDTVDPEPVRWIWDGRYPLGKIIIHAGIQGGAKTLHSNDMAARISTGTQWPDGSPNKPGNVIFMSAEDDLADTTVPRLQAAGADLSRIFALEMITKHDPKEDTTYEVAPTLTEDLEAIEREIKIHQPRLLVIDPINAFLPGIDTHRDAELRSKVFAPLKKIAERYRVTILGIMHLNKSVNQSAIHRVSGSIAYTAAARAAYLFTEDKDEAGRKLILPLKFNCGPEPPGLAFKIMQNTEGQPIIAWEKDPVDMKADEALKPDGSTAPEREAAEEFLIGMLENGSVPASDIYTEAEAFDISKRTLKRAKKKLQISAYRTGSGPGRGEGKWWWELPESFKGAILE